MPVRARLSRYRASLLDKKPLPPPSPRKAWSWSAGSAVDELALHEAQRYLANDWDVEAVFLNVAHYDSGGRRMRAGMWEPSDEIYNPHAVIKQAKYARLPYVEVKVAIPGQWLDTAIKLRSGAVKTGHRLAPVARRGYRLAREQVRKHRPPQDRISETEPGRFDALREQLAKAGVLISEDELAAFKKTVEGAPAMFTASDAERLWERIELARSKVRIVGPEGVMHLAELSMDPRKVFCGGSVLQWPNPSNRGYVWALPDEPSPRYAKVLCTDCARTAEQVAPAAASGQTKQPWIPEEKERETFIGALDTALSTDSLRSCPACERDYGAEGVSCHRTPAEGWVCERAIDAQEKAEVGYHDGDAPPLDWPESISQEEQMAALRDQARLVDSDGVMHLAWILMIDPAQLQKSRTRCDFGKGLPDGGRRFQSGALPDDPTPAEAVRVCLDCVNGKPPAVAVAQPQDSAPEAPEPAAGSPVTVTCGDASTSEGDPGKKLGVTYLPVFLTKSGLVSSTHEGFRLITIGEVTVDGAQTHTTASNAWLIGKMLVLDGHAPRAAMLDWDSEGGVLVAREILVVRIDASSKHIYLPDLMVRSGMASSEHEAIDLFAGNWVDIRLGSASQHPQAQFWGLSSYQLPSRLIGARIELRPGHPASAHPEAKFMVHSFAVLSQGQTDDVTPGTPVEYDVWDDLGSPQPHDHQDDPKLDEV